MLDAGILTENDPVELIHGQIVEMSPENSPHRICIAKANRLLVQALSGTDFFVQPQSTLPLDEHNVPEPDLAVLRGTPDDLLDGEPDDIPLAVEVSDTTLAYDRTEKLACYASNDIPGCWIVNLQNHTLECYRQPTADEYRERRTLDRTDTVRLPFNDTRSINVGALLPSPPETDEKTSGE